MRRSSGGARKALEPGFPAGAGDGSRGRPPELLSGIGQISRLAWKSPFADLSARLSSRGFTLIEVLVALAIVAIALAAAIRAVGLMTDGNGLLRDKSLALLAAESRLAELRLGVGAAPGNSDFECSQGRLRLYCEQRVEATDDPALLWVEIRVRTQREQAVPLARLNTLLSRSR